MGLIARPKIRSLREIRQYEENYTPPDTMPVINDRNWHRSMEDILEWLRNHLAILRNSLRMMLNPITETTQHLFDSHDAEIGDWARYD